MTDGLLADYEEEVIKIIKRVDARGKEELSADLITEELMKRRLRSFVDLNDSNSLFWRIFGRKGLRPWVSRLLSKLYPGQESSEIVGFLPAYPRVQARYEVVRDNEPVRVLSTCLTDDELEKIEDQLGAASRGFAEHQADVRRFRQDTQLNDDGVRIFIANGTPVIDSVAVA